MTLRRLLVALAIAMTLAVSTSFADEKDIVPDAPPQPVLMQAQRAAAALEQLGSPLPAADVARLAELGNAPQDAVLSRALQELMDRHCLAVVHINPEMRVKASRGAAVATLAQGGWTAFLVKVINESGTQAALNVRSPQAEPVVFASSGQPEPKPGNLLSPGQVANRFLELRVNRRRPMTDTLLGGAVEYPIIEVYTNGTGPREAELSFDVGAGTQDLAGRNALALLFDARPSGRLVLGVRDTDGSPAMASFVIRDRVDRRATEDERASRAETPPWGPEARTSRFRGIYPLPSRRVAMVDEYPDFYFQRQIYRADGEHVELPAGTYDVLCTRGPEYLPETKTIEIAKGTPETRLNFELKRWTHLAALGWYSGDHHVHAGGCSHYESPEAGVTPLSMFRQAAGEDLNVACVLTWGPCWYHQKTFFQGETHALSTASNLMRYDVEVSGFPSSHAGHVCLLRLKEDDYPGTTKIEEWPSWTLPVLEWAQSQGGVVGYAHSGWGLEPQAPTNAIPNYVIPKFDGIGANEYIVTGALGKCDFISTVDTPAPWELNIWYHTLNCGVRTRISGETDFPCIYDERVGMGRSYAKLAGALSFDAFVEQIRLGGNYVSDGKSHIIEFRVDEAEAGIDGSELRIGSSKRVHVSAKVAAYLPEVQDDVGAYIAGLPMTAPPYWDLERSRVGTTRQVKVELIVNGYPVDSRTIAADGAFTEVSFDHTIEQSSWVALRVLPSSHTNPIFVLLDGKPIRASRRSAEWCLQSVDRCWEMKRESIRPEDRGAAEAAYDAARQVYKTASIEAMAE